MVAVWLFLSLVSTKWREFGLIRLTIQVRILNLLKIYQRDYPKASHKTFILSRIERLLKQSQKKKSRVLHRGGNVGSSANLIPKIVQWELEKCILCMPECW